ncbi:HlyD family efflux transporter periplasmic adaptor subunit [uncultured Lacinutrix sp.]|uniref:HlyD family secretion protein n=1 Tax=uncultured Lacinutrix sp. TaxID=574032 RepID=UPI0026305AE4|nr:HlyD family efflux transporter periplasmic adaptor subunit [uncultured Lacinutrix sp.]
MSESKKKIQRRKIDDLNERSDQVKEILGQPPGWLISRGISLVFIILLILILGSALISYNDIIQARVTITSKNPPAYLDAKASGKLEAIFVEADKSVKKDDVLAVIESTADYKDVRAVKQRILEFSPSLSDYDSIRNKFPSNLRLGAIQRSYHAFRLQYQEYLKYNTLNPEKNDVVNLQLQINTRKSGLRNSKNQLEQYKIELGNAENLFRKEEELYKKGIRSEKEYLDQQSILYSAKRRKESLESSISSEENGLLMLKNQLRQARIGDKGSSFSTDQNLEEAKQNLENEILQWERLYLIKSPIKGKVTLFDVWNKYQNVNLGDVLFTVVPDDIEGIIGRVTMPVQNSGKVKPGQDVIIKLNNYPYQEWGSLNGTINNISAVPKQVGQGEASYTIFIDVSSLETSFNKTLDFKQEMQGTAEIVVEELTVMQRIFYQLREVFSRN